MFEGFTRELIETPEAAICVRRMGSGPPLLLLHGYPQNHLVWHRIAPGWRKSSRSYGAGGIAAAPAATGTLAASVAVLAGAGTVVESARGTGVLAASTGRRL